VTNIKEKEKKEEELKEICKFVEMFKTKAL
jgi:hypothetical protein